MPTPFNTVSITASTTVKRSVHAYTFGLIAKADGLTVTLPAATGSGVTYKFLVTTSVTSNNYIIQVANANDVMAGSLGVSTDIGGTIAPTASTSDTITMNGSTTGGLKGSYVELVDIAANLWFVQGTLLASGTEATPFSAAVS